jgi:ribosomal protein L11 methyltransferase
VRAKGAALESEMPRRLSEAAAALMHWSGALGVELDDGQDLSPPGSAPLPKGRARLRGHFSALSEATDALSLLRDRLGVRGIVSEVAETDWVGAFRAHFAPRRVGRLYLTAPWHDVPTPEPLSRVIIEPGLAFGTGDHATTELCLRALDAFLMVRPGDSVLDVGTGSGILAIAAKRLGAGRVVATDNDARALQEATENAARNDVEIECTSTPPEGAFDLVLANILANTLIDLAPELAMRVKPRGQLCLCGLLRSQVDAVERAYARWLLPCDRLVEGDWVLLKLLKEVRHGQG